MHVVLSLLYIYVKLKLFGLDVIEQVIESTELDNYGANYKSG